MSEIIIFDSDKHGHLVQSFADIHIACTEAEPMTLANFVLPFTSERKARVRKYWEERLALAQPGGTDTIVMAFTKPENSNDAQLSGYVILQQPVSESGPHRGDVQKLFVSPDFRRQGIARKMLLKLEDVAREHGRWMLVRQPFDSLMLLLPSF